MKEKFTDFFEAWDFVSSHPANSVDRKRVHYSRNYFLKGCLDIMIVKVNPKNNICEDQCRAHLNTKTRFWFEYGEVYTDEITGKIGFCHDAYLDCGGDTFEEAIINLANKVKNYKYYRDMETNTKKE